MTEVNTTNIVDELNEILVEAQSYELTTTCPYGTLNNITVSCIPEFTFSGTQGNTTTAGYYATYSITVGNIENFLSFTIQDETYYTSDGKTAGTYSTSFTGDYYENIIINGNGNGKAEVYIPQSQTCATACWTCTSCVSPCSLNCACGLKSSSCDCTTTCTTWPSTYTPDFLIPFSFPFTGILKGCVATGEITYTVDIINPKTKPLKTFKATVQLPAPIYIYNIEFSDLKVTFDSVSAPVYNGITIELNVSEINSLIASFLSSFTKDLNNTINEYVYEFVSSS
jgi:hypothetical protein